MRCAWKELLAILPHWMRQEVDKQGKETLQELRLRINAPPELVMADESQWLTKSTDMDDLNYCVNTASRYSPWAASTAAKGYITAPGGHRIGLCGEAVYQNGTVTGIRNPTSLCIRIARDFPGIAGKITCSGSILILGAPGWGKTTLLRDLIRCRSDEGEHISVVDERGELGCFPMGSRTDVLTGCAKAEGIPMLLRTMGPRCIAVDEITEEADCYAMMQAVGCGVDLLATVHAASIYDLRRRSVYRILLDSGIIDHVVILRSDKSFTMERMT